MTTPSHIAGASERHRPLTARRLVAVVAVLVTIIGAPFVVQAIADDSGADAPSTQASVELSKPSSSGSGRNGPLHDAPHPTASRADKSGTDDAAVVEEAGDEETAGADANDSGEPVDLLRRVQLPGGQEPEDARADRVAAPALDIHALLTDPYTWGERSLRVAALQQVLNVGVDGWYSPDTRLVHLGFLDFAGLSTEGVPDPAPPGPSAEEWAALRTCESGGDYSIVSSSGRYRGAYQFARTTWDSVAERHDPSLVGVDPATASPAEQDAMARALYREAGAGPWPLCGRHLS
jgi:hypothetical protein